MEPVATARAHAESCEFEPQLGENMKEPLKAVRSDPFLPILVMGQYPTIYDGLY